jgi:antitoxin PrlF
MIRIKDNGTIMPKYNGSITTTGRSEAIRLDKDLFRQHPEFQQKAKVQAHVIAPGQILISLLDEPESEDEEEDPVVIAFLGFLEQDMMDHPERIQPITEELLQSISELTQGVNVSDNEVLPDEIGL